jgi:hypothetical protein
MRRASKTQTLSPQRLKHFASAAVAITCLLAVLASGEEWGASAQIEAIEAKNQLAATQAEKLGTKKIATSLKIKRKSTQTMDFGDSDAAGDDGGGGDGGGDDGSLAVQPKLRGEWGPPPPKLNGPGTSLTVTGQTLEDLPPTLQDPNRKRIRGKPTQAQIEAIKAAARGRSGRGESTNPNGIED